MVEHESAGIPRRIAARSTESIRFAGRPPRRHIGHFCLSKSGVFQLRRRVSVAHVHRGLERIVPRCLDPASMLTIVRVVPGWLQLQLPDDGSQDAFASADKSNT